MSSSSNLFENKTLRNKISFEKSDVIFISDFFVDEYSGGAELSTEALFETSPYKIFKAKSREITLPLFSKKSDTRRLSRPTPQPKSTTV